ncbi:bifunctional (p)ppGpp synthetase/guanosine-3',5'-bis(diphosphate) 3'-pyrophosphohydrolase [bacterium]|nr:bifunctional (p)ppGpp synthetase/guanosine-3',5'-bis(diphosphate) 3'-pyrophosphohydrolase [bacterium]
MCQQGSSVEKLTTEVIQLNPNLDLKLFHKALEIASQAHIKQKRLSGENYIIHPLNVALILAKMKSDTETICAAILHDTLEDTSLTEAVIKEKFGEVIFRLVEGVTKLDTYHYIRKKNQKIKQAENFRKLLLFTLKDVRVLLIKLADRLHNMRTISFMEAEKQILIAQETLEIYAPLANRFGLSVLKSELENISFKIINPEEYRLIDNIIKEKSISRDNYIKNVIKFTVGELANYKLDFEIQGRSKDYYSIYLKHLKKSVSYEEIYDLIAIRIITSSIELCYRILGIIHSLYQPINNRFKDYISNPKDNNYQSLHTLVLGPDAKKIEFQIRTEDMHLIAEEGIAAHWKYKDDNINLEHNYVEQINKIRNFITLSNLEEDFIESFKSNFLNDEIIVITPHGDYIKLPKDSTTIDFAFALHTEIGLRCTGARVNSVFVPLRTTLKNGDIVSIITSPKATPSYDCLRIVKTAKAKASIKSFFKKKLLADAIVLGKEIFDKRIRKSPYRIKHELDILEIAQHFKISNIQDFYANIGRGKLDFSNILSYLNSKSEPELIDLASNEIEEVDKSYLQDTIYLDDINNLMVNFAKCCNPKPGDDILGYVTRGRGITIHKQDCHNKNFLKIKENENFRIFKISWDKETVVRKPKKIEISGYYNKLIFFEIVQIINNYNIDIKENSFTTKGELFQYVLFFDSNHFKNMKMLLQSLKRIEGVNKVKYWENSYKY